MATSFSIHRFLPPLHACTLLYMLCFDFKEFVHTNLPCKDNYSFLFRMNSPSQGLNSDYWIQMPMFYQLNHPCLSLPQYVCTNRDEMYSSLCSRRVRKFHLLRNAVHWPASTNRRQAVTCGPKQNQFKFSASIN